MGSEANTAEQWTLLLSRARRARAAAVRERQRARVLARAAGPAAALPGRGVFLASLDALARQLETEDRLEARLRQVLARNRG